MTLPGQSNTPSLHALGKFRHRCPLCRRSIAGTHFKRHLAAHDRRVAPGTQPAPGATSAAWLAFLDGRLRAVGARADGAWPADVASDFTAALPRDEELL